MRHAIAPGTGDPDEFTLGDCSTQRNLSETGREQAAAIGRKLEEAGVKVDVVYSSEWCRARQTAELLGLAPVESASFLNSFFEDRTEAARQNRAFRNKLEELAEEGRKALFVTHQVNITELTGVYPASGEIVLITLDENGEVEPGGSIHE
ncbi:histidine phosphatase family protein [Fulvimarina endophytica]|uniref:Histidine phosphatase family protein n=2 Tax=Fulvimarina endophytica TaxID=2293836 RepID=A0A371XBC7_9HYPH|nr:histidine phosphatase family protein [Fulvimarina endophytica]